MSYAYIDDRVGIPSSAAPLRAAGESGLRFPTDLDLCRGQVPAAVDRDAMRLAAEARKSTSRQAFRPAFSPAEWRTFASFCITRRLPADFRVLIPGTTDRALRFVVEGSLRQECPVWTRPSEARPTSLLPGTIVGEDTLFDDGPCELDVRTLAESLVLELSQPRRAELTASYPAIAFALLRAAGAVIASRLQ